MYLAPLDDGVRATARQLIGARYVTTAPCIPDTRFTVLFSEWTAVDRYNHVAAVMLFCSVVYGVRAAAAYRRDRRRLGMIRMDTSGRFYYDKRK